MTADDVAAFGQLADLLRAQEAASADEVRRHETVPAPASPLQPFRDRRVVRLSAIIHGDNERSDSGGEVPPVILIDRAGENWRFRAGSRDAINLRVEVRERSACSGWPQSDMNPLSSGWSTIDVVEEQRDGAHQWCASYASRGPGIGGRGSACRAARCQLPSQVVRQPRLSPGGRSAPGRVDRLHVLAACERRECPADGVQVVDDGPLLNDDVRVAALVVVQVRVQIDRAGVDPVVHAQQRHADAIQVAIRQRPEAAVRVAVLGADPRVQDERAGSWDLEDLLVEQHLAACDRRGPAAGAARNACASLEFGDDTVSCGTWLEIGGIACSAAGRPARVFPARDRAPAVATRANARKASDVEQPERARRASAHAAPRASVDRRGHE